MDFTTRLADGRTTETHVAALTGGHLTTHADRHLGDVVAQGVYVETKKATAARRWGTVFAEVGVVYDRQPGLLHLGGPWKVATSPWATSFVMQVSDDPDDLIAFPAHDIVVRCAAERLPLKTVGAVARGTDPFTTFEYRVPLDWGTPFDPTRVPDFLSLQMDESIITACLWADFAPIVRGYASGANPLIGRA